MTIYKSQRVNALQKAKAAEMDLYALYSYLDDLDLIDQAETIDDVLIKVRSVSKYIHDLDAADEPKPMVSVNAPIKR